jgi:hypothetical protein
MVKYLILLGLLGLISCDNMKPDHAPNGTEEMESVRGHRV